jgi:RHS repeat-associated protein
MIQNGRVVRQINNTGLNLTLSYQVITDTAEIASRGGGAEAAALPALLVTTATDQNGAQTTTTYGSDGLLRVMTDPVGAVTRYRGYTTTRQATEMVDALGHTTQYAYNNLGLPTIITDTLGQVTRMTYDAWGNPLTVGDTLGHTTNLTYAGPNLTTLTDTSSASAELSYGDQAGSITTTLAYNTAGDVTTITDALGRATHLTYDAVGRPITIVTAQGDMTTLVYDVADHVQRITQQPATGTAALRTTRLTYDAVGNLISLTDPLSQTTTYAHDSAGRVITQTLADGRQIIFSYDGNGNRLSATGSGDTISGTYNAQDQLLQHGTTTYTYTLNGELAGTVDGTQETSYTYDAFGNLAGVTLPDGRQITYLIDGEGRRIGKKTDGMLVQGVLYQDDLRPIAELDGTGNVVSQFVYATQLNVPDYLIKGGQTYRIIADERGSPRLIVNADTGQIAQRLDYDTFGAIILDTNPGFQTFGFAGGLYDRDTQLTHFGAREYDAETGRWTAKDPLGFGGGDTNLYRYVGNDSVNFVDPTGQSPIENLILRRMLAGHGGVFGGLGVLAGLLISKGSLDAVIRCFFEEKMWIDLLIGIGVGALAGYFAPVTMTLRGAMLLGAISNFAQYTFTEAAHNRNPVGDGGTGMLWSTVTGAVGGFFGGSFGSQVTYRGRLPVSSLPRSVIRKRAVADFLPSLSITSLFRSTSAALASNYPLSGSGSNECGCR